MDWYPWYFTLYEQDTMHLNPYQDGCYRRLIDHYMKTRCALPDNDAALARIVGDSEANWVAMARPSIMPFFQSKDGLLYLFRCEVILNDQDQRRKSLSESGKSGAKKRWKKRNEINETDSHPIATPLGMLKPSDSTGQDRTVYRVTKVTLGDWVPKKEWDDYCKHRGRKFTAKAQTLALAKLEIWRSQGHDPAEILNNSIMNGWTGLFEPKTKGNQNEKTRTPTKSERAAAATARALANHGIFQENPDSQDAGPVPRQLERLREGTRAIGKYDNDVH